MFAVAAVDEGRQANGGRTADVLEGVQGGTYAAAGEQHVVHEHDDLPVDAAGRDLRRVGSARGVSVQIVAIHRDVERADGNLRAAELADEPGDAVGQWDAASRDAQEDETVGARSEEHTSELQSLMRISYAVFCLKKKNKPHKP